MGVTSQPSEIKQDDRAIPGAHHRRGSLTRLTVSRWPQSWGSRVLRSSSMSFRLLCPINGIAR